MICKTTTYKYKGMTLLEMVISMAIITIVFAAVMPQFRNIQNSWASRQGGNKAIQNGRILMDHMNRNLSKAVRIAAVSDSSQTNGFIQFEDNNGNNLCYDIGADNYIRFGPAGDLSDLAGPVSQLRFICYGLDDLDTPITDVNSIRLVKVETTLTNPAVMGRDKTFTTSAYLNTNAKKEFLTLGNSNIEDGELVSGNNFQFAVQVIMPDNGLVKNISAYISGPPSKKLRCAVYTDNSGEPGTLVVESDAVILEQSPYHWHKISIANTELSAGTYWLAMGFEKQNMKVKQSVAAGLGQIRIKNENAVTNGFSPWWGVSDGSDTCSVSIYATYMNLDLVLP